MITFFVSITALLLGYLFYGKYLSKVFGVSSSIATPVKRLADGIDYKELKPWRIFVIQFLNIAGLGPIFGAILGAAYGPIAYLWIVVGCIFMGAAHDFMIGMLSLRNDGISLPGLVGKYLGKWPKILLLIITPLLLFAVGSSFVTGPADLLTSLTSWNKYIWLYIIFGYYILATLLPIDKIIGKIYPFMGGLLLFMATAICAVMLYKGFAGDIYLIELTPQSFKNFHAHPESNILIPMLFIVVSCGAISGFHSTQSPLMARCISDEKYGRPIFYGAMICEGVVALIWATAAMAFFNGPEGLNIAAEGGMTPAIIVDTICKSWLGKIGAIVAVLGVVVCPITSGDTAFRSLRLVAADALKYNQKPLVNRLFVAVPIFVIALFLCNFDFSTIWKFVGIMNQVLATICLWTISKYLSIKGKNHLLLSIPATFMTFICVSYFMIAPHKVGGLALNHAASYITGVVVAVALFIFFILHTKNQKKNLPLS